jgi:hypothetical protein
MKCEEVFETEEYISESGLHNSTTSIVPSGAVLLAVEPQEVVPG